MRLRLGAKGCVVGVLEVIWHVGYALREKEPLNECQRMRNAVI